MSGSMNRRAAIGSLLAAGAMIGAQANSLPNAMSEAILLHRIAWNALGDTCNLTDEVLAESQGREISEADQLAHRAALDAEQAAQDHIFGTAISSLAEMRAFLAWATWLNDGDEDIGDQFLETMRRAPILAA